MEIYLVRHTTPLVEKGICYGQTDLGLADSWPKEFKQLKTLLPKSIDQVYTSPLQRCTLFAKELSTKPVEDKSLLELHFGDWELKAWDDIPKDQLGIWMRDYVNVTPPGAEPFQNLIERTQFFLDQIKVNHFEKVALITHAGVIRALLGKVLGMAPKDYFKLKIDYGSVSKVQFSGSMEVVEYTNRNASNT